MFDVGNIRQFTYGIFYLELNIRMPTRLRRLPMVGRFSMLPSQSLAFEIWVCEGGRSASGGIKNLRNEGRWENERSCCQFGQAGLPATPRSDTLVLLPSGPDTVRRSCRAGPSLTEPTTTPVKKCFLNNPDLFTKI